MTKTTKSGKAKRRIDSFSPEPAFKTQHLEFTDFPRDEITLWFANKVIYLPSEQ